MNVPLHKRRAYCSNIIYCGSRYIVPASLEKFTATSASPSSHISHTFLSHLDEFWQTQLTQPLLLYTPAYSTGNAIQTSAVYYNHGPVRSLLDSREKSLNLHPRNHRFMKNFLVVYYAVTHPPFPSAFIQAFSFSYIMPATATSVQYLAPPFRILCVFGPHCLN